MQTISSRFPIIDLSRFETKFLQIPQNKMGSIAESIPVLNGSSKLDGHHPQPLKQSGALEKFEYEDITPVIGREFPSANIVDDFLNAADADTLLRDVAITSEFSSQ